ncbi:TrmB family transcriptional regulator [Haloferax sp. DFSO60]|uniref:TrmB family transcriptional regulator n=1 Tax=Haloferax sp. DFSO60 TaxID=3388652 RepID=UPI0039785D6D
MVSFDRERVEDRAIELLTELSLSDYEARTLVGLLRLGRGSAREVSDIVEVPRSRVYDAVESLHEMGLVDIRYGTPKEFIPVSQETTIRKFAVKYEDLIEELSSTLERLSPTELRTEQIGVWTVTGSQNVNRRVIEFINDAQEEVVFMSEEELLTDEIVDALSRAEARGIEIYLASADDEVQNIDTVLPNSTVVDTLWEWSGSHISRLLLVNDEVTLVSVERSVGNNESTEVAIWGRGTKNNLVVVLRTIFAVQFGEDREEFDTDSEDTERMTKEDADSGMNDEMG